MFIRSLVAACSVLGLAALSGDARAIPLVDYGTGEAPDWRAPKIAPRTACESLMLYAADVPSDPLRVRRYRFTGTCTMNVAPEGKMAAMRTVDVLINAEYSPKMKRASETIVVDHPDLGVQFNAWATCGTDPYVAPNVKCTDKGMAAHKFSAFISRDDAPYAANRATSSQVTNAVARIAPNNAKIWTNPTLTRLQPIGIRKRGEPIPVTIDVAGGAGMCPLLLDYGDGSKERLIVWGQKPFVHQVTHTFAKPGAFKVTAHALPGCTGESTVYAIVK